MPACGELLPRIVRRWLGAQNIVRIDSHLLYGLLDLAERYGFRIQGTETRQRQATLALHGDETPTKVYSNDSFFYEILGP